MIQPQLKGRDIDDENVLAVMRSVDRELFVPDEMKKHAYDDSALPIGRNQTISQPYIVAYMAQGSPSTVENIFSARQQVTCS